MSDGIPTKTQAKTWRRCTYWASWAVHLCHCRKHLGWFAGGWQTWRTESATQFPSSNHLQRDSSWEKKNHQADTNTNLQPHEFIVCFLLSVPILWKDSLNVIIMLLNNYASNMAKSILDSSFLLSKSLSSLPVLLGVRSLCISPIWKQTCHSHNPSEVSWSFSPFVARVHYDTAFSRKLITQTDSLK